MAPAEDAYAAAGVSLSASDAATAAIVASLKGIDTGSPSRVVPLPGHFAAVLRLTDRLGIALGTDGVGSKLVLAEQAGRFDTVGIDCVAMNANDVVCVGAEPIALLDYLAVEEPDAERAAAIGRGLARGAAEAGCEVPGGELAVLPELIRGHPSPTGFDLVATCIGTVDLDAIVTGERAEPGDALLGLPSSGIHSNGYTLARRALFEQGGLGLDDAPAALGGQTVADVLLEPTTIYVKAVLELVRDPHVDVRWLAHITGGGLTNLLRGPAPVGFEVSDPLPVPPVFRLVQELGDVAEAELWEVFNMGCGFCVVVPAADVDTALDLLAQRHPGVQRIGTVTDRAGRVEVPSLGVHGDRDGLSAR